MSDVAVNSCGKKISELLSDTKKLFLEFFYNNKINNSYLEMSVYTRSLRQLNINNKLGKICNINSRRTFVNYSKYENNFNNNKKNATYVLSLSSIAFGGILLLANDKSYADGKKENVIDGKAIANQIHVELAESVKEMKETLGVTPGLAVILVGERKDSQSYVKSKKKACADIGITSYGIDYPATVTEAELIQKIDELNAGNLS